MQETCELHAKINGKHASMVHVRVKLKLTVWYIRYRTHHVMKILQILSKGVYSHSPISEWTECHLKERL